MKTDKLLSALLVILFVWISILMVVLVVTFREAIR